VVVCADNAAGYLEIRMASADVAGGTVLGGRLAIKVFRKKLRPCYGIMQHLPMLVVSPSFLMTSPMRSAPCSTPLVWRRTLKVNTGILSELRPDRRKEGCRKHVSDVNAFKPVVLPHDTFLGLGTPTCIQVDNTQINARLKCVTHARICSCLHVTALYPG
jgi:hypothetical protein